MKNHEKRLKLNKKTYKIANNEIFVECLRITELHCKRSLNCLIGINNSKNLVYFFNSKKINFVVFRLCFLAAVNSLSLFFA